MARPNLRSVAIGLALGALVAGSLAGCTSTVSPKQAARQGCTPNSARVHWDAPVQGMREPVEAHLISFENGVTLSTPIPVSADSNADFSYPDVDALSRISSASETSWQASLLKKVRATKTVPSSFGDGTPATPSDITPKATSGKYVVVTEEALTIVRFTITCSGEKPLSGSVSAFYDSGTFSTITRCGSIPSGTPQAIVSLMGPACTRA